MLDSVETNLSIWRVRWPSPRQVQVQNQRVQDKSETIEKRLESGLEYYSPNM